MKAVLLDADTLGDGVEFSSFERLPVSLHRYSVTANDEVATRINDADIILTNKVVLTSEVLAAAPRCKYVGVLATGTNNVPVEWCRANQITVQNVEQYGTATVAQHTLALLLSLATQIPGYHQDVQAGKWSASPYFCLLHRPVMELAGKHAVIVGYGELGQRVAGLFTAMGMKVSVAARPGKVGDTRPSLNELLPEADVLSLHCQLSEETKKMVNAELLALMKPSAFIINTARGGLIDEAALLSALQNNHIGGAALDVLSTEPPPADHILLQQPVDNLIITPHSAWTSRAARQRLIDIAAQHVSAFLEQQNGW